MLDFNFFGRNKKKEFKTNKITIQCYSKDRERSAKLVSSVSITLLITRKNEIHIKYWSVINTLKISVVVKLNTECLVV